MSVSTIFGQLLSKISISISSQKRAIVNVIIMGLTAAAERIISVTVFRCPCITQTELDSGETNYWYGVAYFAAPAVVLFLLAVLVGVNIWIGFNGCCRRAFPKRQCEEHCVSCEYHDCSNFCTQFCCCSCNDKSKSAWCFFFKNIAHALIAPSAWFSLALLDGNSLACAIIPLPYFLIGNETCDEVTTLKNSDDYNDKRGQLQAIGWGLIAGLFLLTAVTYTCSHCCSSKTYFQHKFQSMYRRKEQQALEEEIYGNENTDEKIKNAARVIVESQPTPVQWDKVVDLFILNEDVQMNNLEKLRRAINPVGIGSADGNTGPSTSQQTGKKDVQRNDNDEDEAETSLIYKGDVKLEKTRSKQSPDPQKSPSC